MDGEEMRTEDDFIELPTGIDFRRPGSVAPWDRVAPKKNKSDHFADYFRRLELQRSLQANLSMSFLGRGDE